jgi:hypothetical protein
MPQQPLPLDPFGLTQIGVAIWMTNVIVARQVAQAIREQNALITRAIRGGSLTRSLQIAPKGWSRERPAPCRGGAVATAAPLKRVLVYGESGGHEAFLATPLAGVPVDADRRPGSDVMSGPRRVGFVFQRSGS